MHDPAHIGLIDCYVFWYTATVMLFFLKYYWHICVALQIDSVAEEVERCKSTDDMVSVYIGYLIV
jgi:hypothetical protein